MRPRTAIHTPSSRPLTGAAVLLAGALGVAVLAPGPVGSPPSAGLGSDEPVLVTGGLSARLHRGISGAVADGPGWLGGVLEVVSEGVLLVLGALLVWVVWRAWRGRDAVGVAGAVLTGVGTVVAYAGSEALKLVVDEERPCRAMAGRVVAGCPAVGDWSFPSNHATLAVALAVGLALTRPRLAWVVLPLGAAGAVVRVAVGVHYPHDVAAGAVLAASVTAAVLLVAVGAVARLVASVPARRTGEGGRTPVRTRLDG
ncbi:phosphatase PAP2 family protein [Streptomyces sp. NPDC058373]|uniref:phosphatase PAP2 family protein n=1 Tax=Streptomyces sp. NPDC058373 TaxID=3346465 RepID=UPI00364AC30F